VERELTAPARLTDARGQLNADAVGWSRHPLHDTSGIDGRQGWPRNKRWEYWCVMSERHILATTVSSIDYAAVNEVWLLDRVTGAEHHRPTITPFGRGSVLPPSLGSGTAAARAKDLAITITEVPAGTRLEVRIPGVEADIVAGLPAGHERLGVVVPWSSKRFQYTVKDVARPASGTIVVDGESFEVRDAWAVLDHGRGRWPYDVRWNWAAGSGTVDDRTIGLQLGGQWTDGTGSTENSLYVDGRLHKISEDLEWRVPRGDLLAPWRIRGARVDLTLVPFHLKESRSNLGVVSSRTDQCFGTWSGWVLDDHGAEVRVDGTVGFAEDVHNRW
jgi:hypothetical protein